MSLRSAAEQVDNRVPGPKCGVAILRLQLDDLDRKTFDAWLDITSGKSNVWISEVLSADDKKLSDFTIGRHRKRKCSCAE